MTLKYFSTILTSILMLYGYSAKSQELISNAGDQFTSTGLNIEWSLGEIMIETYNSEISLTQGFHQGRFIINSIYEQEGPSLNLELFPNPAVDHVQITKDFEESCMAIVYDQQGRQVLKQSIDDQSQYLNIKELSGTQYYIQIQSETQGLIKTFKLIKIKY